MDNGYVIQAGNRFYGPYISYSDAYRAMEQIGISNGFVRTLNGVAGSVIVNDCDRPECRHCRSMEREAAISLATNNKENNNE